MVQNARLNSSLRSSIVNQALAGSQVQKSIDEVEGEISKNMDSARVKMLGGEEKEADLEDRINYLEKILGDSSYHSRGVYTMVGGMNLGYREFPGSRICKAGHLKLKASSKEGKNLIRLATELETLKEEKRSLKTQLEALLKGAATVKKLLEVAPQLEPFIPADIAPKKSLPVPVNVLKEQFPEEDAA